MKNQFLLGCTVLCVLLAHSLVQAQPNVLTIAQWQQDVRALAEQMPKMHRSPYNKVSQHAFDSAVAVLHAQVPRLQDHEIVVGLTKLVAMIGDGHTRLTLPQDMTVAYSRAHSSTPPPADSALFLNHLPVKLALFDDGLFIRETTPDLLHLVGAEVVQIGSTAAKEALEKVRPVVHYDNEMGFKHLAPTFLVVPEFLEALGIAEGSEEIVFEVKTREGAVMEVILSSIPQFKPVYFVGASEATGIEAPLSQWNRKEKFWLHMLEDQKTLYVQLNESNDKDDETLAAFVARIERIVAGFPVEKLVLDLRYNPGGNNHLNRSLVLALARSEQINRFGKFYTLIGRETFSAAQLLANDLEFYTSTLFVGEPSGSSPSAYGDSRKMQLPNSKLTIRVSTIYWRDWHTDEKRPWTAPDLPVGYTSKDYLAGRDPALEAVLQLPYNNTVAGVMRQVYERAGFQSATWVHFRAVQDARADGEEISKAEKEFGEHLLLVRKSPEAIAWYSYISGRHKEEAWPLVGLAKAHLLGDEHQKAAVALEKAIQLQPTDSQAKELLAALKKKPLKG
ncbi:S41 family peptidase [Pontibacter indicus]|uniref:Peptidase family S41 n=1 Tax=Pontibacter indicus TaxID=1317125 RepID=A0A1R3XEW6_9BACT|nr:S41 family peptidase [Pontibacter indicus]SIT88537.1 Peptidase family S41 [Pontibacter indicus]